MNRKLKRFFKRVSSVFLALVLVVTYALYNSSDRILLATSLSDEEEILNEEVAEEEQLDESTVAIDMSAEQPQPEVPEPAPVEENPEPVWEEPAPAPEEPAPAPEEPQSQVPEIVAEPEPETLPSEEPLPSESAETAAPETAEPEASEEPESEGFSIVVSDTSVVYDGMPHSVQVTVSNEKGVSLSYNPDQSGWQDEAPELTDVGSIRVAVRAEKEGSDPVEKKAVLEVTPREVVVTCDENGKYADDPDPELTASVSGVIGADTIQYTVSRDPGEEPGTYAIHAAGEAVQGNYSVRFEDGVFTIEEPEKPAQRLETTAEDGARIVVTAPAGALPEGAYVRASVVSSGKAAQAIAGTLDAGQEIVDVVVYDITIHAENGDEIEPDHSVNVAIYGANVQPAESVSVYHIPESGGAEKVADADNASSLQFSADHFSEYAVVTIQTAKQNENNEYEVAVGQSAQLPLPEYYYSGDWSSKQRDVVTVDNSGVITGVREGTATVELVYKTGKWGWSRYSQTYEIRVTAGQPQIVVS
ncbi:MAG: Ig-like domain-containing protein, partial [Solobacterium sp.]|nr:Ig-like domain-containing protein [Solobacterium sp.]